VVLTAENLIALIMVFSLIVYVLTGGADFGGGVWDLLATGKRAPEQRKLIANVLAPIWEANHIWLILMIVLLFVDFPKAYSTILTFLHFPTTIMLFGIVLRGSAFVFRKYDEDGDKYKKIWSLLFAIGSIVTPFFLGIVLGAITIDQPSLKDYVGSWVQLFPMFTGLLTLAICAYLAAVYLTLETNDEGLKEDFRIRALISGVSLLLLTVAGTVIAYYNARYLFHELTEGEFAIPLQFITLFSALAALVFLYRRKYQWARVFAVIQVVVLLFGWMITQYPDLITGHLTIAQAAAPYNVLIATLLILGFGSLILVPSFIYLFIVFRGRYK
jgi:cytochrome d ubiquinol oxidase subunit II